MGYFCPQKMLGNNTSVSKSFSIFVKLGDKRTYLMEVIASSFVGNPVNFTRTRRNIAIRHRVNICPSWIRFIMVRGIVFRGFYKVPIRLPLLGE